MAMSINNSQNNPRLRRSPNTKPVVPAANRSANARKLEPVPAELEFEELDFEATEALAPVIKPRLAAQAEATRQARLTRLQDLTEKRDLLIHRLDTGAAAIEEARAQGKDVTNWEDFWIDLLRNYERVCDTIRKAYSEE